MAISEADMVRGIVEKQEEEKILAFLMVGQSNMAGRGDLGEVEPIDNEMCRMFRMGMWHQMTEPINIDKNAKAGYAPGIGLAASFADELQKYTGKKIGLIPCAQGGTKIEQWVPGSVLYDNAVFTAKLAMRSATLGGIIWHQGESNCLAFRETDYMNMLVDTLTAMRRELGAEDLPLIMGELSSATTERWSFAPHVGDFNKELHKAAARLPNCAVASEEGLTLRRDGLHFNSASCREFGKRYFEKYLELTK